MIALYSRERMATCAAGIMGALADCATRNAAIPVDSAPVNRTLAGQVTPQPDQYGPDHTLTPEAVDVTIEINIS